MRWVLGIETATPLLSVAVVGPEGVGAERTALGERLHSVRLLPFLQEVLADVGICLREVTGIAVTQGPGSFTGLRLGVVTAKTLAQVLGVPVVGVPTLLALAAPLLSGGIPVGAVLTSRRDEVYAAVYGGDNGEPRILLGPLAAPPEQVAEKLISFPKLILAGEGAWRFKNVFTAALGPKTLFAPEIWKFPRASAIAALGYQRLARGEGTNVFTLLPEYLRPPAITGGAAREG